MALFEKSQKIVGLNEGGYQKDPRDKGNWYKGKLIGTNWGISAPVLAKFLGRTPTVEDMKKLPRLTAEQILKLNYWEVNHFGKLDNQSVATLLYDGAVNHGVGGMRSLAEKALVRLNHSVIKGKVFAIQGIELLNKLNQKELFSTLKAVRTERYKASAQKEYITSWLNRLKRIQYTPDSGSSNVVLGVLLFLLGFGLFFIGL